MDWTEVINRVLFAGLAGLGSLFVWYIKFKIPRDEERKEIALRAQLKTKEQQLIASLERKREDQEYNQNTENVAIRILRESVYEKSREVDELREAQAFHNRRMEERIERLATNMRTLAGIIQEKLEAKR